MKKVLWSIVLVLWMIIIFIFSGQTGDESKSVSNQFTIKLIDEVALITNKNVSNYEKERIVENSSLLVRKTAHFTLYFILGIFAYFTFKSYGIKNIITYSILFCFLYACSDEIHQLYSLERAGRISDVLIDTIGGISGILPIVSIKSRINIRK